MKRDTYIDSTPFRFIQSAPGAEALVHPWHAIQALPECRLTCGTNQAKARSRTHLRHAGAAKGARTGRDVWFAAVAGGGPTRRGRLSPRTRAQRQALELKP